jgi:DNA-binding transcriptional regulator YhcF (GntR family)
VRELAAEAAVNPNTMQRALQELEARGLINTQRTAGRTVTGDEARIAQLRRQLALRQAAAFLSAMRALGYEKPETLALRNSSSVGCWAPAGRRA